MILSVFLFYVLPKVFNYASIPVESPYYWLATILLFGLWDFQLLRLALEGQKRVLHVSCLIFGTVCTAYWVQGRMVPAFGWDTLSYWSVVTTTAGGQIAAGVKFAKDLVHPEMGYLHPEMGYFLGYGSAVLASSMGDTVSAYWLWLVPKLSTHFYFSSLALLFCRRWIFVYLANLTLLTIPIFESISTITGYMEVWVNAFSIGLIATICCWQLINRALCTALIIINVAGLVQSKNLGLAIVLVVFVSYGIARMLRHGKVDLRVALLVGVVMATAAFHSFGPLYEYMGVAFGRGLAPATSVDLADALKSVMWANILNSSASIIPIACVLLTVNILSVHSQTLSRKGNPTIRELHTEQNLLFLMVFGIGMQLIFWAAMGSEYWSASSAIGSNTGYTRISWFYWPILLLALLSMTTFREQSHRVKSR